MPRLIDANRIVYSWTIDNDGEEHDGVTLQSIIDKMPTVDAVPVRHGHWTSSQGSVEEGSCWCTACKTEYYADDLYNVGETDENGIGQALMPNYCPHCGAKMDEVDEWLGE